MDSLFFEHFEKVLVQTWLETAVDRILRSFGGMSLVGDKPGGCSALFGEVRGSRPQPSLEVLHLARLPADYITRRQAIDRMRMKMY